MNFLVFLSFFLLMECVAWFTHKYIMHGLLWIFHQDHHLKKHPGFFERNDFFFLIFAIPGIILILTGIQTAHTWAAFAGAGITAYGFTYFLVHDIFIHQRFKLFRNTNNAYLKGIRRAHKIHHKHIGKEDGECFGMLWVPFRFFKKTNSLID